MARRKDQAARRGQLVGAAARVIVDRGLSELRIKDIADEAGLSPGSVLYYYPDLDVLVTEVHRDVVERFYQARRGATADGDPVTRLLAALRTGLPSGPDDAEHRLLYELHQRADESPLHAALMTSLFERETALYETILEVGAAAGPFRLTGAPHDLARTMVSLEDGLGLHILSRNPAMTSATASAIMLGYASTATGVSLTALHQRR